MSLGVCIFEKVDARKTGMTWIHTLPQPQVDITSRAFNLQFSSNLPGGFANCSMSVLLTRGQAYEWYERMLFHGVMVYEGDEPMWEGRINGVKLREHGVDLECEGYWSSMADQVLTAFWADNDMQAWKVPSKGAGGVSDEISMTQNFPDKYILEQGRGYLRFATKKDLYYYQGDKGVFYYVLPDITHLVGSQRRVFGPLTIHSIQFTYSEILQSTFHFTVWTADKAKGTWTKRYSAPASGGSDPATQTVNLEADGADVGAVAVTLEKDAAGTYVESNDDGWYRWVVTSLTIYAERDATIARRTTAQKITLDLLKGNSDINVSAHAKQVSDDPTFIGRSGLEIVPATFDNMTMQEIIGKVAFLGMLGDEVNKVDNPSAEITSDVAGWTADAGAVVTTGTDPAPPFGNTVFEASIADSDDDGVTIKQRDGNRFPVTPARKHTFLIYLKWQHNYKLRIRWYDSGSVEISDDTKNITTATAWAKYSLTAAAPDNAVTAQLEVKTNGAQGVTYLRLDAARFVEGEVLVYIDGDQPTYVWSGASHMTTSHGQAPALVGVFGRNRLHVKARDEKNTKWLVSMREIAEGGMELERTVQDFWSRVWVKYQEAFTGLSKITACQVSQIGRTFYHDERDNVVDLGEATGTFALNAAQELLRDSEYPHQQAEITLKGTISNVMGGREPLWRVRAGDLLMVQDLTPFPMRLDPTRTKNPLRTFTILETSYDTSTGELSLVPDTPPTRLDVLLARLMITPSISSPGTIGEGAGGAGWQGFTGFL